MSKSRWIIDPALVTTFLVCVGLMFFVATDYVYLKAKQDITEQRESAENAEQTKRHISEICGKLSGLEWRECALDEIQATQQQGQDYRDLHAQEWMARWAFWMFIAAAVGTVVALYGLVLIRRTWVEAKRTADVTESVGQAQVRTYVTFDGVSASIDGEKRPTIEVSIINNGASPAKNLKIIARCDIGPAGVLPDNFDPLQKNAHEIVMSGPKRITTEGRECLPFDIAGGSEGQRTLAFTPLQNEFIRQLKGPPSLFGAIVEIRYFDVFGVEQVEQQNFLAITPPGQGWHKSKALERFEFE